MLWSFFIGYLLGSLPFSMWIAKAHGVCIFKEGSGNAGATNVLRTVGKGSGRLVFFLDALKGILSVWIGIQLQNPYVALFGALIGHSYSWLAHGKGGKGVSTLMGGLLLLLPLPLLSGLVVWWIVFKIFRYVSCASICFIFSLLPFCCLYEGVPAARQHALPLFLLTVWILFRHRSNLLRLWQGKENRF